MSRAELIISSSFVRVVIVLGIIACLCFSAGEGLRLTPLTPLSLEQISSPALQRKATLSRSTPNYLGGPLNRPAQAQVQKLNKRQLLDCECPQTSGTSKLLLQPLPYLDADDWDTQISRVSEEPSLGRAPPLIS